MRRVRAVAQALFSALLIGLACFSPSCHRAEIDFSLAAHDAGQGGDAAERVLSGGAGGAADLVCDDSPLDETQQACRLGALPSLAQCTEQDVQGWSGCYAGGCAVCTKSVREYPYYFDWHPCCAPNGTCASNVPVKCNARCPAPTARDKRKPCFVIEP